MAVSHARVEDELNRSSYYMGGDKWAHLWISIQTYRECDYYLGIPKCLDCECSVYILTYFFYFPEECDVFSDACDEDSSDGGFDYSFFYDEDEWNEYINNYATGSPSAAMISGSSAGYFGYYDGSTGATQNEKGGSGKSSTSEGRDKRSTHDSSSNTLSNKLATSGSDYTGKQSGNSKSTKSIQSTEDYTQNNSINTLTSKKQTVTKPVKLSSSTVSELSLSSKATSHSIENSNSSTSSSDSPGDVCVLKWLWGLCIISTFYHFLYMALLWLIIMILAGPAPSK